MKTKNFLTLILLIAILISSSKVVAQTTNCQTYKYGNMYNTNCYQYNQESIPQLQLNIKRPNHMINTF